MGGRRRILDRATENRERNGENTDADTEGEPGRSAPDPETDPETDDIERDDGDSRDESEPSTDDGRDPEAADASTSSADGGDERLKYTLRMTEEQAEHIDDLVDEHPLIETRAKAITHVLDVAADDVLGDGYGYSSRSGGRR